MKDTTYYKCGGRREPITRAEAAKLLRQHRLLISKCYGSGSLYLDKEGGIKVYQLEYYGEAEYVIVEAV